MMIAWTKPVRSCWRFLSMISCLSQLRTLFWSVRAQGRISPWGSTDFRWDEEDWVKSKGQHVQRPHHHPWATRSTSSSTFNVLIIINGLRKAGKLEEADSFFVRRYLICSFSKKTVNFKSYLMYSIKIQHIVSKFIEIL